MAAFMASLVMMSIVCEFWKIVIFKARVLRKLWTARVGRTINLQYEGYVMLRRKYSGALRTISAIRVVRY